MTHGMMEVYRTFCKLGIVYSYDPACDCNICRIIKLYRIKK